VGGGVVAVGGGVVAVGGTVPNELQVTGHNSRYAGCCEHSVAVK